MGRTPCCSKVGLHRGPWTAREDSLLINYIQTNGEGHWRSLPKKAGLLRCGKSCRLRWMNYLRPDIKRGNITPDEDDLIIRLHSLLGNRWSLIAKRLPGRTDNEIKNYWNSHLSKKLGITDEKCPSKSKSSMINKKKMKQKKGVVECQKEDNRNTSRTKVHLPKATRVSPSSVTKVLNFFPGNQTENDYDYDEDAIKINGEEGYDYDNILAEMFEEYQQLLQVEDHEQMDSFVDSLLV